MSSFVKQEIQSELQNREAMEQPAKVVWIARKWHQIETKFIQQNSSVRSFMKSATICLQLIACLKSQMEKIEYKQLHDFWIQNTMTIAGSLMTTFLYLFV